MVVEVESVLLRRRKVVDVRRVDDEAKKGMYVQVSLTE